MMIVQDHTAAEPYDRCAGQFRAAIRKAAKRRVMAIAGSPYISGTPFRIKYFEQVLDEISKHDDVALYRPRSGGRSE